MAWRKLHAMDDWGNRYVLIGEPHMSAAGTWGISFERERDDPTPVLDKAGWYRARFPDGHEETVCVVMRGYSTTVGDHGHDYPVSGEVPVVVTSIHGSTMEIDPVKLGLEFWTDEEGRT